MIRVGNHDVQPVRLQVDLDVARDLSEVRIGGETVSKVCRGVGQVLLLGAAQE